MPSQTKLCPAAPCGLGDRSTDVSTLPATAGLDQARRARERHCAGPTLRRAAAPSSHRKRSTVARVLVTDAEQRSSLAAVRSLGRAGHERPGVLRAPAPARGRVAPLRALPPGPRPAFRPRRASARPCATSCREERDRGRAPDDRRVGAPGARAARGAPGAGHPLPGARRTTWRSRTSSASWTWHGSWACPCRARSCSTRPGRGGAEAALSIGIPLVLKPARSAVAAEGRMGKFGVTIVTDGGPAPPRARRVPAEAYPLLVQERDRRPRPGRLPAGLGGADARGLRAPPHPGEAADRRGQRLPRERARWSPTCARTRSGCSSASAGAAPPWSSSSGTRAPARPT